MLSFLDLPLLHTRRAKTKLTTFYKIINDHLAVPTTVRRETLAVGKFGEWPADLYLTK